MAWKALTLLAPTTMPLEIGAENQRDWLLLAEDDCQTHSAGVTGRRNSDNGRLKESFLSMASGYVSSPQACNKRLSGAVTVSVHSEDFSVIRDLILSHWKRCAVEVNQWSADILDLRRLVVKDSQLFSEESYELCCFLERPNETLELLIVPMVFSQERKSPTPQSPFKFRLTMDGSQELSILCFTFSATVTESRNESERYYLRSSLFPKLCRWFLAALEDKEGPKVRRTAVGSAAFQSLRSLSLVDLEGYSRTYERLKIERGKNMAQVCGSYFSGHISVFRHSTRNCGVYVR